MKSVFSYYRILVSHRFLHFLDRFLQTSFFVYRVHAKIFNTLFRNPFLHLRIMRFYVTLTTRCNLECRYCYGKLCDDFGTSLGDFEIDYDLPSEITYNLNDLEKFCENDPDLTLIFYGGEPLLRTSEIRKIMDGVRAKRYMIQTNGLLLNNLGKEYLSRFHTMLVSIDGDEELTDYYRGKGVYRRVVDNVKLLESQGFAEKS